MIIKVHIECFSKENNVPESLQDIVEPETQWSKGYIMKDQIVCFYESDKGTIMQVRDENVLVKENIDEIACMINEKTFAQKQDFQ